MRNRPAARRALLVAIAAMLVAMLPAAAPARADDPIFEFPRVLSGSAGSGQSIASADFDGDGATDLVLGYADIPPRLFLNRNDGAGGFLPPVTIAGLPASTLTRGIAAADFNQDGAPDLALAGEGEPTRVLLNRNDGSGGFGPPAELPVTAGLNIGSVAVGDLDGANGPDIVAGSNGGLSLVFRNNGAGVFSAYDGLLDTLQEAIYTVAVADLDGASGPDIVAGNIAGDSYVFLNPGDGDFDGPTGTDPVQGTPLPTSADVAAIATGDVNADGLIDLLLGGNTSAGSQPDPSEILLNTPASPGTFQAPAPLTDARSYVFGAALADVNADGALDALLASSGLPGTQVHLSRADGSGALAMPSAIPNSANFARGMAVADFDGDAMPDLALVHAEGPAQLFTNRLVGSGTAPLFLAPGALTPTSQNTLGARAGDLNNDGLLDLVLINANFANNPNPGLSLALINTGGAATFADPAPIAGSGRNSFDGALGDINGDGWLDLVLVNSSDNEAQLFLNSAGGEQIFLAPSNIPGTAGLGRGVAVGDLDADGRLDVVLGYQTEGTRISYNSAVGLQSAQSLPGSLAAALNIALADLNGDGRLDIVLGNYIAADGTLLATQVYLGQPGGFAAPFELPGSANLTNGVGVGDLDGDGDLDLALSSFGRESKLYLNNGNTSFTERTLAGAGSIGIGIALGDLNGDGQLDILLGNYQGQLSEIYLNRGGGSFAPPVPLPGSGKNTTRVTLGDFSGDGAIDLVLAGSDLISQLFLNAGVSGFGLPTPVAGSGRNSFGVALGDLNNDGWLDLFLGNNSAPSQVFLTSGAGGFGLPTSLSATVPVSTTQAALGDFNNDSFLDVALSNRSQPSQIYLNNGSGGFGEPQALPDSDNGAQGLAVGDLNGDGALDIVLANNGIGASRTLRPSRVYLGRADGSGSFSSPVRLLESGDSSTAALVGDLNGDGALDIVLANYQLPSQVYLNPGSGDFAAVAPYLLDLPAPARAVQDGALADFDGDGDLDIALGAFRQPSMVYPNKGDGTFAAPLDIPVSGNPTSRIAAGDLNGDGAPDLVLTSFFDQPSQVLINRNDGSGRFRTPESLNGSGAGAGVISLAGATSGGALGVALGDVNRDGGLDIVLGQGRGLGGSDGPLSTLYLNRITRAARLAENPPALSVRRPGVAGDGGLLSAPEVLSARVIGVPFRLADPEGDPVRRVRAFFSLDGGGRWLEALPDPSAPPLTELPAPPSGASYTFPWDTYASGFFGQGDEVTVRVVAELGGVPRIGGAPGPFQRASVSATTFPFRVLGTQVRVLDAGAPVPNALVYRLPQGRNGDAQPIAAREGAPSFTTNAQGFLRGRGELNEGDSLVALAPVGTTAVYSPSVDLYHTNITPTRDGLTGFVVSDPGIQAVQVEAGRPLALFNLQVSLEWDARNDADYMRQLRFDLRRASEFLFDATNGQAALGYVDIFHDKENWNTAHIRVYASNRVRPNAVLGGVASANLSVPVTTPSGPNTLTYGPGLVKMGAVWNRFGNATAGSLSEDWPRTLAHELGHFLLFLDDNYLGLRADGAGTERLVPIDTCPGLMGDPYASVELHPDAGWTTSCGETLSNVEAGRSDWATVKALFPELVAPAPGTTISDTTMIGPLSLPLAVTEIYSVDPLTPTARLDLPFFYATDAGGGRVLPGPRATAFLFQDTPLDADSAPDRIVNLGRTTLDRVTARGARVGDRLCLFEPDARRLGCETIGAGDEKLETRVDESWRPDIVLTPVTSRTLGIQLRTLDAAGVPADLGVTSAVATLYPTDNAIAPVSATLQQAPGEPPGVYSGQLTLGETVLEGYIHVQASPSAPLREAVSSFSIGGNPGVVRIGGGVVRIGGGVVRIGGGVVRIGGSVQRGGGVVRIGGGVVRIGGGIVRIGGAPVSTAEGDVLLLADELQFDEGDLLTLQSVSTLPAPPVWATVIGAGYRLTASDGAPDLRGTQISFGYQAAEVPAGEEESILVYYLPPGATDWQALPTTVNSYHNLAAASNRGPGLYALMSSVAIPLNGPGFNLFGYPVRGERPVAEALAKIDGYYTAVYGYNGEAAGDPWLRYFPGQPAWVNNLERLEFGKGYWLDVTEDVTLLLRGASEDGAEEPAAVAQIPVPPGSYFGEVGAGAGFTPAAGMAVEARVDDVVCGRGTSQLQGGKVVYVVDVAADGALVGCGASGQSVRFSVGGQAMQPVAWSGAGARPTNLVPEGATGGTRIFVPLIRR